MKSKTTYRASGSCRPSEKMPIDKRKKLITDIKGLSQRDLANKYDISQSYVNYLSLHAHKKKKKPLSTEAQIKKQMVRIDRLYRTILLKEDGILSIILEVESYFTLRHNDLIYMLLQVVTH